ncbi:MAG: hypothetical protein DHS20C02_10850 [Micavibrio sp.]|nr:MAG: hypothetical protein DHS20C02_10850 [Micavibrio sp.]
MSRKIIDLKFPQQKSDEIELQITRNMKKILRDLYRDFPSALKWICIRTGVQERAARNWYDGRNPPNSGHLLILARRYPAVLQMILGLVGRPDLAAICMPKKSEQRFGALNVEMVSAAALEGANFCTINVTISLNMANKLNQRQLWFIGMLQQGYIVKAKNITNTWAVSLRTAKYDISSLTKMELIRFVGTKKTGRYEVIF